MLTLKIEKGETSQTPAFIIEIEGRQVVKQWVGTRDAETIQEWINDNIDTDMIDKVIKCKANMLRMQQLYESVIAVNKKLQAEREGLIDRVEAALRGISEIGK